jgi:hypothetical protein
MANTSFIALSTPTIHESPTALFRRQTQIIVQSAPAGLTAYTHIDQYYAEF